jgi:hypothetical protein
MGQDERIDLADIVFQALRPELWRGVDLDVMALDDDMDAGPGAPVALVLQVQPRIVMGGQGTSLRSSAAHDEDFHSDKKRAIRPESKSCLTE